MRPLFHLMLVSGFVLALQTHALTPNTFVSKALISKAWAVMPDEVLQNPLLEKRARELSKELRCLVCQNQSIDDSDAGLARDLRVLVRERLVAGDSDTEVLEFVVARYGDFVLLRPPVKGSTVILWGGPVVIVLLALILAFFFYKRGQTAGPVPAGAGGSSSPRPTPLTAAEQKKLQALMDGDAPTPKDGNTGGTEGAPS